MSKSPIDIGKQIENKIVTMSQSHSKALSCVHTIQKKNSRKIMKNGLRSKS